MKRDAGYSLLELAVVLVIFAMVALIGAQVLQVTTRSNDRLTAISDASSELASGLALLRNDLASVVPRRFFPADGGRDAAVTLAPDGFSISVGGLAQLSTGTTGFGRVEWRFDATNATLARTVWTSLTPGQAKQPAVSVLEDITAFKVEAYNDQGGWSTNAVLIDGVLPRGLRVTLNHNRTGELVVVENLR